VSAATSNQDLPRLPAIVRGHVEHQRRSPVRHAFRHSVYQWLVDLDHIPRLPWFLRPTAGFDARDHLGGTGPDASADIKTNVRRFLACRGMHLGSDSRVLMLANARFLGHVFNPLTVFWCFDADGTLRCIVAEVHNTYGDRHAYLVDPDDDGAGEVDKQLYVSPFNDVSGGYRLRFELSSTRVRVGVSLVRDGAVVFGASFDGSPSEATASVVSRTALRWPAMPLRVAALIRLHGIRLWLRGLPILDRPVHRPQRGV
jgi:uncharacterized protein